MISNKKYLKVFIAFFVVILTATIIVLIFYMPRSNHKTTANSIETTVPEITETLGPMPTAILTATPTATLMPTAKVWPTQTLYIALSTEERQARRMLEVQIIILICDRNEGEFFTSGIAARSSYFQNYIDPLIHEIAIPPEVGAVCFFTDELSLTLFDSIREIPMNESCQFIYDYALDLPLSKVSPYEYATSEFATWIAPVCPFAADPEKWYAEWSKK